MRLIDRNNPFQRIQAKFRPAVFFAIIIVFLFFLSTSALLLNIRHNVRAGLTESGTVLGYIYSKTFAEKDQLSSERDHYRLLAETYFVEQAELIRLQKEHSELQLMLEYQQTASYDSIPAKILARSPAGQNSLLIDKGEKHGVREGVAIVGSNGSLIGIVQSVNAHTSIVGLLSDPNIVIPASFLNKEGTQGVIHGIDGYLLKMEYIPQGIELLENTIAITSGFDGNLPHGIPIGIVESVEKNVAAPFQEAFIAPIVDPRYSHFVLIIDPLRLKYVE